MKKGVGLRCVIFIIIFLACGEVGRGFAQQIGMYSHSFYKPMIFNPAFSGSEDETNVMLISRSQWTDFKDAPQLTVFTIDGNLLDKKVGLGLGLISDRKGITNRTSGNLFYSYKLIINDDSRLFFGLSFGIKDQTIDFSKALVEDNADPTLYTDSQHKTSFDACPGVAFLWKELEFSAAVPQIIGNKLKPKELVDSVNVRAYYTEVRHYMISLKYNYLLLKERGISIAPTGLVRFVPHTPFQFDGTVNVDWKNKCWIGATYKSDYAVAVNVGFCIQKQLFIGYSYDFIIGGIGKYSGLSHEIMVNFKFGNNKRPEPVAIADTAVAVLENPDYENRLDELQNQLKINQEKLKELNDKLDQQAKMQLAASQLAAKQAIALQHAKQEADSQHAKQVPDTQNPKQQSDTKNQKQVPDTQTKKQPTNTQGAKPGIQDSDGIFVIQRSSFKNSQNKVAEKGYYVIVGIFFYRDFANDEVKNFVNRGFKNTNLLYYENNQNNYVFTHRLTTKEEAFGKVKEVNADGGNKAWILKLED